MYVGKLLLAGHHEWSLQFPGEKKRKKANLQFIQGKDRFNPKNNKSKGIPKKVSCNINLRRIIITRAKLFGYLKASIKKNH